MSDQGMMSEEHTISAASEQAIKLFERALQSVSSQNKAAEMETPTRLFFPSGIELITIKFDVGTAVKIQLTIAGKDANYGPENSLMIDETAEDSEGLPGFG